MVSFYVKNKQDKEGSIFCSINYQGIGRFIIKVPNIKVHPKDWEKGWIKTGRGKQKNSGIESYLLEYKTNINNFYTEYTRVKKKMPKKDDFLKYLKSDLDMEKFFPPKKVIPVLELFKEIVDHRQKGIELNRGKFFSEGTVKGYKSFIKRFEKFIDFEGNDLSTQDIIEKDFVLRFQRFCTIELDLRLNPVNNNLKILKTFLEILVSKDLIPYNPFKKFKIPITWVQGVGIALNDLELKQLFDLDLSNNIRLDKARDQFKILCLTGLRESDLLTFIDIEKDGEIVLIENKKTGKISYVPIFPELESLLNKYDGKFPKLISSQKLGDYIKEIGKMLPILNKPHKVKFVKGGKPITEIKPRYMYLSSHVGRRTLITFLSNLGIENHIIQLISAHSNERDLKTYIRDDKRVALKKVIEKVKEHRYG